MVVALDAGHGGKDPGAGYNGRQEKDDVLKLTKAVGQILSDSGVEVFYTREEDIYETPYKKTQDANGANADIFVSFHRNSSEYPNQYSGAEVLLYDESGIKKTLAENILEGMENAGFKNLGTDIRKDLVVLRRTQMPAVLIEAGFINTDADNEIFDREFDTLAKGIADGILKSIGRMSAKAPENYSSVMATENDEEKDVFISYAEKNGVEDAKDPEKASGCNCNCTEVLYRVQVGAFKNREYADRLLNGLLSEGYPAFIVYDNDLYKVQVGAFKNLSNAVRMEYNLRQKRYNTYITTK